MKLSRTVKTLKNLAKRNGINQRELAEKTGTTAVSISRWFNGVRQPTIDDVEKIALALDSEIRVVFRG